MVYKFVVLSNEDEQFVREFEFLETQSLMDFHMSLQEELEFDRSQMASFFLADDNWEKEEEFTLFEMGTGSSTMDDGVFDDIGFRKNQKLLYVFDFFNDRALFIEYVGQAEENEDMEYPICTGSKGFPPKQVVFGNAVRKKYNAIVMNDDDDDDDDADLDLDVDVGVGVHADVDVDDDTHGASDDEFFDDEDIDDDIDEGELEEED